LSSVFTAEIMFVIDRYYNQRHRSRGRDKVN